jgi:hypothetical protein
MSRITVRVGGAAATIGLAALVGTVMASPASAHAVHLQNGGVWADLNSAHSVLKVCHQSGPLSWVDVRHRNGNIKHYRAPWPGQGCFQYGLWTEGVPTALRLCYETSSGGALCGRWVST